MANGLFLVNVLMGVPLPVFYAENGEIIMTKETVNHVADLFAEHGSNIWFEREAKDLLPEGFTHPGSLTVHLLKKQTLWTFGLILVHHTVACWKQDRN